MLAIAVESLREGSMCILLVGERSLQLRELTQRVLAPS